MKNERKHEKAFFGGLSLSIHTTYKIPNFVCYFNIVRHFILYCKLAFYLVWVPSSSYMRWWYETDEWHLIIVMCLYGKIISCCLVSSCIPHILAGHATLLLFIRILVSVSDFIKKGVSLEKSEYLSARDTGR